MAQFLVEKTDLNPALATATLRGEEAHHLLRSMRARPGDPVRLFDGQGNRWQGVFESGEEESALITNLAELDGGEPPVRLHLIQGLIKGERWEWLLEKAVELGVWRVTPLFSKFSVVRPSANMEAKRERWQKRMLGAAKQCERGIVPTVDAPVDIATMLKSLDKIEPDEERCICVERDDAPPMACAGAAVARLAVGPEGGWDGAEVEALTAAGFAPATLGPRVLRSETAGLAALVAAGGLS